MNITIDNNDIFNDGKNIGVLVDDTVYLEKNIGPSYKAEIKRQTGKTELKFVVGTSPTGTPGPKGPTGYTGSPNPEVIPVTAPTVPVGNTTPPDTPATPVIPVGDGVPSSAPVVAQSTAPVAEVAPAKADPEPKQHPSLGTKDPAWLAWKNRQGR